MAKATGPLFSLEASGTVGKTITYSRWKGRPYVRVRVIPLNPYQVDQVAARNRIRGMAKGMHWANATLQILDGETERDELRIRDVTPDTYAWNGYLVDMGIGPGAAYWKEADIAYGALAPGEKTAWDDAADALVPPIPTCPVGAPGGGYGESYSSGCVFFFYMYALYKMDLYTLPGAVPPVYA